MSLPLVRITLRKALEPPGAFDPSRTVITLMARSEGHARDREPRPVRLTRGGR